MSSKTKKKRKSEISATTRPCRIFLAETCEGLSNLFQKMALLYKQEESLSNHAMLDGLSSAAARMIHYDGPEEMFLEMQTLHKTAAETKKAKKNTDK